MEVNKKQLADIFGASIRTIQNWQEQGMPVLRGGGKGNEVLYDSAAVIKWYAERDAEIENEKLRREVEELRQASETDLQPGTIEYERHRLTRAQADAQELKNARDSAEVVETAFCTFVLSRIAGEIASILDGIPLSVQRRFPELENRHVDFLKRDIIKAMYAATIESELDTQSAMDFILGANSQEQRERLTGWIGEIAAYYAAAPVRLGGAKVPHLMPGDSLNLQTAQDTDNGYSVFEQSLLRYIAAGLGVSYEQLSRNYAQMSYSTARASANESWAYFMGRRKFVASRQASQMFLCWLEEAIARRVVTLPSKARFSFQEARSAWGNCDWIGSGRMAIDGLKEVQEAVMLIEAGLSTYEKECAKRGDDYQEVFAQQVRETMERRAAGLKPPAWAAAAFESGLRQSTEEEKSDSRAA